MVAIKARFDGEKIEIPPELRGAGPGEVIVIFNASDKRDGHSIWDVVGRASSPKSADELDREIREERDSWSDR